MAYSSIVIVSEVNSSGDEQGRKIALVGPGLPFQGAEWSMEVRVKTTWYPGNGDEGTQQVLGPIDLPSKWQGDWRRTMMGRTPSQYTDENGSTSDVINPSVLRDVFELIARAGKRLRVVWAVTSNDTTFGPDDNRGRLVREGRMTRLNFKHIRLQDIQWQIEFEWVSRGATSQPVTVTRSNSVNSDSAAYQDKIKALIDANDQAAALKFKPSSFSLGQLEAIANYPTSLINSLNSSVRQISSEVSGLISIANTLASQPVQIRNRALALAKTTIDSMNGFKDQISQIPAELKTTKPSGADFFRAHKTFGAQSDAADAASRAGQEFMLKLRTEIQARNNAGGSDPKTLGQGQNVERVYVSKAGDTPQSVSQKFYGTPDHAVDILRANKLSWFVATLSPGKILLIPALQGLDATRGV